MSADKQKEENTTQIFNVIIFYICTRMCMCMYVCLHIYIYKYMFAYVIFVYLFNIRMRT